MKSSEMNLMIVSPSQEFPFFLLCNPKIRYCGHKSSPLDINLNELNPFHTCFIPSLFNIRFNMASSLSRPLKWSFSFRVSN